MLVRSFSLLLFFLLYTSKVFATFFAYEPTTNNGVRVYLPENFERLCDDETYAHTKELFLNEPYEFLNCCVESVVPLIERIKGSHRLLELAEHQKSQEILNCYMHDANNTHRYALDTFKTSPLCMLHECQSDDEETCPLSRKKDSDNCPRVKFERKIIKKLKEKDDLDLIFYASGDCFFETKLSLMFGNKVRSIVFIDPYYNEGLKFLLENEGNICSEICVKAQAIERKCIYLMMQIIQFLSQENPQVKIFFYQRHQDYLNDFSQLPYPKASLICGADYQKDQKNLNVELERELMALEKQAMDDNGFIATAFCFMNYGICMDVRHKE